jgi:hypothetical protein
LASRRNHLRDLDEPDTSTSAKVRNSKIGLREWNGWVDDKTQIVLELGVLSIEAIFWSTICEDAHGIVY